MNKRLLLLALLLIPVAFNAMEKLPPCPGAPKIQFKHRKMQVKTLRDICLEYIADTIYHNDAQDKKEACTGLSQNLPDELHSPLMKKFPQSYHSPTTNQFPHLPPTPRKREAQLLEAANKKTRKRCLLGEFDSVNA